LELKAYLTAADQRFEKGLQNSTAKEFGYKNNPNPEVVKAQRAMGIEPADGIVGPMTRNRAKELGVTFPPRRQR
jgi:hypothetical protein